MNLEDFLQQYMRFGKEDYKKYSIKSYKDNPELKAIIDKFLKKHKDKIGVKACYHNSALMTKADPRIGYCEGYMSYNMGEQGGLPIEHAWNVFGEDYYFDMTSEELFNGDIGKGHNEYVELYRTNDSKEAAVTSSAFIRPYMRRGRK